MPRFYLYHSSQHPEPALLAVEKDHFSVAVPSDPNLVRCRGFVWRYYNRDAAAHLSQEEGRSLLAKWQEKAKVAKPAPRCPLCGWPRSESMLVDTDLNEFLCANCKHSYIDADLDLLSSDLS